MELFFADPAHISPDRAVFDEFESRHILKTLRKTAGDLIDFTDGAGSHYRGEIIRERPALEVRPNLIKRNPTPGIRIIAGIGFIKQSRLDFIIEKGTELGIDRFMFFESKNAAYFTDNIVRWNKISRQAIKQSLRFYLPEFMVFRSFAGFLDAIGEIKFKLLADQSAEVSWPDAVRIMSRVDDDIIFVIGPEGGLDRQEIDAAIARGFKGVTFGNFRLRTETAVLSAATLVNLLRT